MNKMNPDDKELIASLLLIMFCILFSLSVNLFRERQEDGTWPDITANSYTAISHRSSHYDKNIN